MTTRLLYQQHRVAALAARARGQAYRPLTPARHYACRRALTTTAVVSKAGREWDYIDGPTPSKPDMQRGAGTIRRGSGKSSSNGGGIKAN
ncbi:hypothetical protein H4217_004755, partial [Coemansia sp. RSA 1939]